VSVTLRTVVLLLLAGPFGLPPGAAALTVQEAILRAKPAVVLIISQIGAEITLDCGKGPVSVSPTPFVETGSGWLVDGRGYLVTNAHVVDPVHRLPPWVTLELKKRAIEEGCLNPELRARSLPRGQRAGAEERIWRDVADRAMATMKIVTSPSITVLLSNGTKLPAEVKKFSPPLGLDADGEALPDSGRDLALLRVKDGVYPALAISTKDVQIGDSVHILGFPALIWSHELLKRSVVSLEASVTNGGISGFRQDAIGQDVIQADAPATHGNSGGPAIGNDAAVVGVMTFVSLSASGGAIVQGFNFFIPARDVRKFLEATGVHIGESRFNAPWADALAAFFKGDYPAAAAKLTRVNTILPDLPDVKRKLAEAQGKHPPPRPFPWPWIALGVTVVSLCVYGGMFGRRWWKNRFRILPTQVIGLMEKGLSPILLDARSRDDFETSPLKLPGALRLSPEEAAAGRIDLDAGADSRHVIITYCTSPGERTSAAVAQALRQKGLRNVRILKGGLGGWTNARLPVEAKSHLPSVGLEIYKNLTLAEIERRRFAPQQLIFKEGDDPRGEAYVVHAGVVEIRKRFDGGDKVLTTLHEGELFGQIGLFLKSPRSASAVAVDSVELLIIKSERLEWLMRNHPQLTLEIVKGLSEIVVATDRDRSEQPGR